MINDPLVMKRLFQDQKT